MSDMIIPFVCPNCDDDCWVEVDKARTPREIEPDLTCPACQEQTSVKGPFVVIGPV